MFTGLVSVPCKPNTFIHFMEVDLRKNEHPGCSCKSCMRGKHSSWGHCVIKQINRRIRQKYRILLAKGLETQLIVPTPYTD